jgi:hypothetical protein
MKITNRYLDPLATTRDTSATSRRVPVLAPPSPESGKLVIEELVVEKDGKSPC